MKQMMVRNVKGCLLLLLYVGSKGGQEDKEKQDNDRQRQGQQVRKGNYAQKTGTRWDGWLYNSISSNSFDFLSLQIKNGGERKTTRRQNHKKKRNRCRVWKIESDRRRTIIKHADEGILVSFLSDTFIGNYERILVLLLVVVVMCREETPRGIGSIWETSKS